MPKSIRHALHAAVAACATLAFVATAYAEGNHNNMPNISERDTAGPGMLGEFDNVAYGYNDGYWDNGHAWHRWNNGEESRGYRRYSPSNYHDWHHERDSNQGWLRNRDLSRSRAWSGARLAHRAD